MGKWMQLFKYDPTLVLRESDDIALKYSFEKDIFGSTEIDLQEVLDSKEAQSILHKQRPDGVWPYKAKKSAIWSKMDYDQYETVKQLGDLVEKYRFTKAHPAIAKTAEYFFKNQSQIGDFRGIYANQYSPNYSAVILELLIKAGFGSNERVIKSLDWLMNSRQDDGGWALAFRTKGYNLGAFNLDETIEADTFKPSSAMVTGVVLRALTVHPKYKQLSETKHAAELLADSFFTPDKYPDRKSADFWTRFGFPFIYTDIVSSLDSLSLLGGFEDHLKVQNALKWLQTHQEKDGSFDIRTTRGNKQTQKLWMNLAICRLYQRIF